MHSPFAVSGILPATFHSTSQASLFQLLSVPCGRKAGPILLFCNYFSRTPHPPNHKSIIAIPSASDFTLLLSVCSQFSQKPKTHFLNGHVQPTANSQEQAKTPRCLADAALAHFSTTAFWSATDPTGDRSFLLLCDLVQPAGAKMSTNKSKVPRSADLPSTQQEGGLSKQLPFFRSLIAAVFPKGN